MTVKLNIRLTRWSRRRRIKLFDYGKSWNPRWCKIKRRLLVDLASGNALFFGCFFFLRRIGVKRYFSGRLFLVLKIIGFFRCKQSIRVIVTDIRCSFEVFFNDVDFIYFWVQVTRRLFRQEFIRLRCCFLLFV